MRPRSLEVDVAGICSIRHECTGCAGENRKCCCANYEVTVTSREMDRIIGWLPLAARFCPSLAAAGDYENVFEELGNGLYSIDTDEDGACVFAYRRGNGLACSLHSAAEELGRPVREVKPTACLLWPLAVLEGKHRVLSVQDDVFEFSCNHPAPGDDFSLCPAVAGNLAEVFGMEFTRQLRAAADQGLDRTEIPLRGDPPL
ncbi:MAG: hypothetical protein R6U29_13590 [Desulfosudaceae bacterium]